MLMQILFSGCKTTSDMTFLFIHIQNLPDFACQSGIQLSETIRAVLMYRTLTDSKLLRRLTYGCLCLNNIFCNFHCPLFDIIFQKKKSPEDTVFTMYALAQKVCLEVVTLLHRKLSC